MLVFDYRGFGTSDGAPRQDVNHRRHREDYHAAIAYARARRGVDPSRIAIWGSSYSGGHVIAVAAKDQRVAAVISQGAAMDGLAALFMVQGTGGSGKVVVADPGRAARRRPHAAPAAAGDGADRRRRRGRGP